ncbi:MAG: TRAP transporter small permease subunit [Labilithrix sp.]|nr:TRAP transporter small permease subunit [Labilithrix sp.]MCW5815087.1 TRAP transporter small permease subunit [Labilithrix sp.]
MADEKKPEDADEPAVKDETSEAKAEEKSEAKAEEKPEAKAEAKDPPPKAEPRPEPKPEKAAWGEPIARLDRAWTKLEARLCAVVLVAEILTLVFWIAIRALSSTGQGGPGGLFRSLFCALVLGLVAHRFTKKHAYGQVIATGAVVAGFFAGRLWTDAGTEYFSNLFAWLQNSSILVFFGGVSDLAKRFTLWLALLGASLATAQGKHINVDVVMRFLSPKARVPVAVIGWLAAALVAISASWGFFDYVAVEEMRAPATVECPGDATKRCPASMGSKVDAVSSTIGRDLFLSGRQISLDLRSLPRVLGGTKYNQWLTPKEWNEWLKGGGWSPRFDPEEVKAFELPEDGSVEFRNPAVTAIPGGTEQVAKLLVPVVNLVFAFGLFVIGLRFIVRSLLAISGHIKVDPNAAHGDDELAHAHDSSALADAVDHAAEESHS